MKAQLDCLLSQKSLVKGNITLGQAHTAVEKIGLPVLLSHFVAGIGNGVLLTSSLASLGRQDCVEGIDEEGRSGGKEDVAGGSDQHVNKALRPPRRGSR